MSEVLHSNALLLLPLDSIFLLDCALGQFFSILRILIMVALSFRREERGHTPQVQAVFLVEELHISGMCEGELKEGLIDYLISLFEQDFVLHVDGSPPVFGLCL